MKRIAENACLTLAGWIFEGSSFAWVLADRIERRFKIQGCTEAHLGKLEAAREDFNRKQIEEWDRQDPDRLTYLHR